MILMPSQRSQKTHLLVIPAKAPPRLHGHSSPLRRAGHSGFFTSPSSSYEAVNFACRNFVDKKLKMDSLRFTHLSPRSLSNAGWAFSDSVSIETVEGKASMIGSLSGGDPYEIK